MSERHDVHSSLADMDRKLRELQQELAQVSQRPQPGGIPSPASAFPAPAAPQAAPAPSPVTPPYAVPPAAPPPAAAQPPPPPPAPVMAGPTNAGRIVQEAASRLVVMSRQIDELHRSRDELQQAVSALAAEVATTPGEPPAPAPPAQRQAPTPGLDPTPFPRPAYVPEAAQPLAPAAPGVPLSSIEARPDLEPGPFAAPPPAFPPPAASSLSGVSPPPEGAANRNQFEGQVVINAGPFTDIATLGAFEQALGRLPRAEEVYVRGFEGNRALIDLRLAGPVRLLEEMRRSVPFAFGVVEVGHGMVTINVEAQAGNSNPAVTLP